MTSPISVNQTIYGSSKGETLKGGSGNDRVFGSSGNDHIWGRLGHDFLDGGAGDDKLYGEEGNDTLIGGLGHDRLDGGDGNDLLDGGDGNDELDGGDGRDTLIGGAGQDELDGGDCDDVLDGGDGNDTLDGGDGDDRLLGGAGHDLLDGDDGDDRIEGGDGNDRLIGSDGDDTLLGGAGNDLLDGGDCDDVLDGGAGINRVEGDDGNDVLVFRLADHAGEAVGSKAAYSVFDGGDCSDTLALVLTRAEWLRADVQADVARFLSFVAKNIDDGEMGECDEFVFTSFNLKVSEIEKLVIVVDGLVLDPRDEAVTARADAITTTEDAASIAINLLANDSVPDLVKTVTLGSPAKGSVTLVQDYTDPAKPVAQVVYTPGATAFQYLAVGEKAYDSFTYTVTDADGDVSTATVTVTITGVNDGPVIMSGRVAGAATEDAGAVLADTGTIMFADLDLTDSHSVAVGAARVAVTGAAPAGFAPAGGFGTLSARVVENTADANNQGQIIWSFAADNASVQKLAAGQTATQIYTLTLTDKHGASVTQDVTVVLTGTNDAPTITSAVATGAVTEDGVVTAAGSIGFADVDLIDTHAISAAPASAGYLGSFSATLADTATGDGAGSVSWTFAVDNAAVQFLAQGQVLTQSYVVTVKDASGAVAAQTVTVTITGTNDAPVATADVASTSEDDAAITGTVAANDSDVDTGAVLRFALDAPTAGLTMAIDGSYRFDPAVAAYQSLKLGEQLIVAASYTVTDDRGATASSTLTITVTGTNDTPVAVADTAAATEDAAVLTGTVATNDSDVDNGASLSFALVAPVAGLTLASDGAYAFDAADAAYQALALGEVRVVTAGYTVTDEHGASASSTLTITVTGTNDAPVAVVDTAAAIEDAAVLTGTVATNDSDVDNGASLSFALDAPVAGLTLAGDGAYAFDAANAAYQALALGQVRVVTAAYTVTDEQGGAAQSMLTITVTGTNDTPVAVVDTLSATEDAAIITGSVASNDGDVDAGAVLGFTLDVSVAGLTLATDGGYRFDPRDAAYQALAVGEVRIVVAGYTVTDEHGATAQSTLTITVTGTNDAPTAIVDVTSGNEDSVLTGSVASNDGDVDNGAVLRYALPTPVAGLTLLEDGSYSFDARDAAYQALARGENRTVTAIYTVTDEQGVTAFSALVVVLTGTNDAPVVTSLNADARGAVSEAGSLDNGTAVAGTPSTGGTLSASDVDNAAILAWSGSRDGAYGSFAVAADGSWTYLLANDRAATQALIEGQSVTETFLATVTDEHGAVASQMVLVTVTGTNDAPVVTSGAAAAVGTVREAGSFDNGTVDAGTPAATGVLTSSDVDAGATATWTGSRTSSYGSFVINAAGAWAYSLANANLLTQRLREGEIVDDHFVVTVTDDKGAVATQIVTVSLVGTNDAPVVTSTAAAARGTVVEAGNLDNGTATPGTSSVIGVLSASDVDGTSRSWSGAQDGVYGSFAITGAGVWTYTLDNSRAATQALAEGQVRTETFAAIVTDEFGATATQVVTLTINGANDRPVVTTPADQAIGAVVEAGTLDDRTITAGTSNASGTLTASDADAGATRSWSGSATGSYGSFTVNAAGQWSYALDNARAATQALSEGQSVSDTFTATVTDDRGAIATQQVVVSVSGTNDAPVLQNVAVGGGAQTTIGFVMGSAVVLGLADTNSDGRPETVTSLQTLGTQGQGLTAADIDGDGDVDIVGASGNNSVIVYTNRGDITGDGKIDFTTSTIALPTGFPYDVAVGDLNGDGRADLALASSSGELIELINQGDTNANGVIDNFVVRTVPGTSGSGTSYGIAIGDLNGDGRADVASSIYSSGPTTIRFNLGDTNGDGRIDYRVQTLAGASGLGVALGDFDGDGKLDLFQSRWDNQNEQIYLNRGDANGDGQVEFDVITLATAGSTLESQLIDIDRDGDLDAVMASYYTGTVTIAYNRGDNNADGRPDFTIATVADVPLYQYGLAVGDIDGDGDYDILSPNSNGAAPSYLSNLGDTNGDGVLEFARVALTGVPMNYAWDAEFLTQGSNTGGTVREDGAAVTASFKGDDVDGDDTAATLTYRILTQPTEGSVVNNGDGSFAFAVGAAFQDLAAGQVRTVSFTYDAVDGHGAVAAPATVTVSVVGTNDAPVVSGIVAGTATEGGAAVTLNALANASDADQGAALVVVDLPTLPAGVTFNATTRSFTLDPTNAAYNGLAQGQTSVVTVAYNVSDGTAKTAAQVSWTVTGTNDAPVAVAGVGAGDEDNVITGQLAATDVDAGSVLSFAQVGSVAGLSIDADGRWALDAAHPDYQSLLRGQSRVVSATYTVSDGITTTQSNLSVTVNGANEPPVARADVNATTENAGVSGDVLINDSVTGSTGATGNLLVNGSFEDPAIAPNSYAYVAMPGWSSAAGTLEVWGTGFLGNIASDGNAFVELDNGSLQDSYSQVLSTQAGRTYHLSFDLAVRSGTAAATNQVEFLVNGRSLGVFTPTVTTFSTFTVDFVGTGTDTITFREPASANNGVGGLIDNLRIVADVDVAISLVNGAAANVGQPVVGSNGGSFTVAANGTYSFDPGTAFDYLAQGQTVTTGVDYTVTDNAGSSSSTVTVTITGTNDAPRIAGVTAGAAVEDGASVTQNALAFASDVDTGAILSVSGIGTLPAGVSFDAATQSFTLDPTGAAYQSLAAGEQRSVTVTYDVTDGVASTPTSMTWIVTGTNDAPVVAIALPDALGFVDAPFSYTVATGSFTDVDSALSYSATLANGAALPTWLSFDAATSIFSGTPPLDQQGSVDVVVTASDGSLSAQDSVRFTVQPNVYTGTSADNVYAGTPRSETIVGNGGNDTLSGGAGADTIYGDAFGDLGPSPTIATDLTATAQSYYTGTNALRNGLGGTVGFGEGVLAKNDDLSTPLLNITSVFGTQGLNFFGTNFTTMAVNNNGNLTFGRSLSTFVPTPIAPTGVPPIIAAFWADVDTEGTTSVSAGGNSRGTDLVYYDLDTENGVLTATWDDVGAFNNGGIPNAFQIQLVDRGAGDFDIIFRYENILWNTSQSAGLPRAGFSSGNGTAYEMAGSGTAETKDYDIVAGNTGLTGIWVFEVRGGQVSTSANDTLNGGAGADTLAGGSGLDLFVFDAGQGDGDTVLDFNGSGTAAGDSLLFRGYGTAAQGATFTQIDATHWAVTSANGQITDVITFANAAPIDVSDIVFI